MLVVGNIFPFLVFSETQQHASSDMDENTQQKKLDGRRATRKPRCNVEREREGKRRKRNKYIYI